MNIFAVEKERGSRIVNGLDFMPLYYNNERFFYLSVSASWITAIQNTELLWFSAMNGGIESTIDVIIVASMTVISGENGMYGALVWIVPKCQRYV